MSNVNEIKSILSKKTELKKYLYSRGFLFTSAELNYNAFPFGSNFSIHKFGRYTLAADSRIRTFYEENHNEVYIVIGHIYNPFDGLTDEQEILHKYINCSDRLSYFNEWTGLFTLIVIKDDTIELWGDCAGMQANYYAALSGQIYISSHAQLIGDVCSLVQSDYAKSLVSYRFWQLYGMFMPGDISQFDHVFRLVPNTYVSIKTSDFSSQVNRFYPTCNLTMCTTKEEYDETINKIASLLSKNLELISKKYARPAISMSGGMDSKTTVACANGLYDKFKYYSYDTMYGDKIDVDAAKIIADEIGVEHKTYVVSQKDDDFEDIDSIRKIMEHNWGDIGKVNANDLRKRIFFMDFPDFDVEVKSWVSEIGRANYYKKFGLKKMPERLSPRQMTSMYKFFSYNRKTAKQTDRIFKEYIEKTDFNNIYNYDSSDMYLWEFRYGSWGGLVITSEHRMSYDITIPFNNRKLMELFLTLPLEKRIKDEPHYDIIKRMNPKIDALGITITNYNETKKRMHLEKLYFKVNNLLPY